MNRSELPESAFADQSGANADAVRDLAEEVLDQLLTQLAVADDRSPLRREDVCDGVVH